MPKTQSLFELEAQLDLLADELASEDVDLASKQELFESFLETEESFKDAASRICHGINSLEAMSKIQGDEAKRIAAIAKVNQNKADRLKHYLLQVLERRGYKKLELPLHKLTLAKTAPKVIIEEGTNPSNVPEYYARVKTEFDKTAIGAALKSGVNLAFARLSEPGISLRIK